MYDKKNAATNCPESKVHGANMGPIWGRQGPGGPHVGPMNFAVWVGSTHPNTLLETNAQTIDWWVFAHKGFHHSHGTSVLVN